MSKITLYRGCRSYKEKDNIITNKTARGYFPPNPSTTAPTNEEASEYVANHEGIPRPEREEPNIQIPPFVEYTTDLNIAIRFNRGGIIKITIDSKYYTKGSGIESGYIIKRDAPLSSVEEIAMNETEETPDSPLIS